MVTYLMSGHEQKATKGGGGGGDKDKELQEEDIEAILAEVREGQPCRCVQA